MMRRQAMTDTALSAEIAQRASVRVQREGRGRRSRRCRPGARSRPLPAEPLGTLSWQEVAMRRVLSVVLFVVLASIDNTVLTLLPELAPRIRHEFGVSSHRLGLLMGLILAVVALTGLAWGYRSDQSDRRRLLVIGTLTWAVPIAAVPFSRAYLTVCALLLLAAVGLGCIATVGYSIITDLVPARWRGFLLGLWGGAQALGALAGGLLAGLLAPGAGWRAPFWLMALVGLVCSGLALLAASPRKGQADTRLPAVNDQDRADDEHITFADGGAILQTG